MKLISSNANSIRFLRSGFRLVALALTVPFLLAACQRDPMELGQEYMRKGSYPEAIIEFKNAVQAKPDAVNERLALADAQEHIHDLAGAEQQLRKALAAGGDENILVPRIALIMLDLSDLDKLTRDFKDKHLVSKVADSSLWGAVALAFIGLKRIPQSAAQLEGVLPTPTVVLAQAQLQYAEGRPADALKLLEPVTASSDAPWWVMRAASRIASASGDPVKAENAIKRARDSVPWHRGVVGEYGEALIANKKFDEATAVRDQLRKIAPNYFWTNYLDALLLARQGRTEESHAAALRVLSVSPDHFPSVLIASSAEIQKGDLLLADKRLQALLKQNPNSLPALRLFAQSQFKGGKLKDLDYLIRRGLTLAPDDAQLLSLRAELEAATGQHKQALATLAKVRVVLPDDANVLLRIAEMQAAGGDMVAASKLLDAATSVAKQDAVLRGRIVGAALRMRDVPHARRLADEGVNALPDDPQIQLTLAAVLSAQGDQKSAWQTTLSVLDKKPAISMALAALSAMAKTPEEIQEVMARHVKAIDAQASDPRIYLDYVRLVRVSKKAKDTPLAILEKGLSTLPQAVAIRAALVDEYLLTGAQDKAVSTAESGAAMSNAPALAMELMAATYERVGKSSQAMESYRKLVANYPQRSDFQLKLADLEAGANRKAEASTLLRGLISERPFELPAYLALVKLTVKDKPEEALSIARQMGQREELAGAAILMEGDILLENGQPDEALKQYAKAVKAGMTPAGLLREVKVLDTTGRNNDADREIDVIMRKFPSDSSVISFAAQRALTAGKAPIAVDLLKKLAVAFPNNPVLLNDLAWAQTQAGQANDAVPNAMKAVAALPHNANVFDTLGVALALAGKREAAIAALRTACNLAPVSAGPHLHLAEQLFEAGDKAGAHASIRNIDAKSLDSVSADRFNKLKASL